MTKITAVAALVLFACPTRAAAQQQAQAWCSTWTATVCADETWDASTWQDKIAVNAGPNQTSGHAVVTAGLGTVDISLDAYTSAGAQALLGVLDVNKFVMQNPDRTADILKIAGACNISVVACNNAIQNFVNSVTVDQLKAAAVWWHGCVNAGDHQTKSFSGLAGTVWGYVVAAQTKDNSGAAIFADITHHPATPQLHTEPICGPVQQGQMPASGDYTKKVVGHISLALTPQHGGTLTNTQVSIHSPIAKGTFSVDASGNILFTGNVSPANCPRPAPPQHFPLRQMQ